MGRSVLPRHGHGINGILSRAALSVPAPDIEYLLPVVVFRWDCRRHHHRDLLSRVLQSLYCRRLYCLAIAYASAGGAIPSTSSRSYFSIVSMTLEQSGQGMRVDVRGIRTHTVVAHCTVYGFQKMNHDGSFDRAQVYARLVL